MSISGIGSAILPIAGITTRQNVQSPAKSIATSDESAVVKEFTDYMKKSPAERMQEDWLAAHGLTKEQFDAMSPEEQKQITQQMQTDIEEKMKEQAKKKVPPGTHLDMLV